MRNHHWPPATATTPAPRPYQNLTARQLNAQADRDREAREQAHRRTLADLEATTATIRSFGPHASSHASHRAAPGRYPSAAPPPAATSARPAAHAARRSTSTTTTLASEVYARRNPPRTLSEPSNLFEQARQARGFSPRRSEGWSR